MKTTLLFTGLTLILFSCNFSTDQDFKDVAKDTCDCMSLFTDNLSDEMRQIMIEADGDEAAFDEAFTNYMAEKPLEGLKDAEVLTQAESPEVMGCLEKLETKYAHVYTTLSEDQVVQKVVQELESMDGCKATVSIMKMGMKAK